MLPQSKDQSKKHEAALELAQLGYPVFPCVPGEKKPACQNGLLDATTDEAKIDAWWLENPNYNIGLSTNGLLVVDIDGADNPLLSDAEKILDLTAAPAATTPRGGRHYFFRQPEGNFRNTTNKLADKVDTRADGGYVVAAPSANGKNNYAWLGEPLNDFPHSLPLPPQWVVDGLAKAKAGPCHANANGEIPKGQRNGKLTSLAGSMRRAGADEAAIVTALLAENERSCNPPLPEDEVRRIAASVSRYQPGPSADIVLSNGVEHEETDPKTGKTTTRFAPLSMCEVLGKLRTATDNWPRCVSGTLFIDDQEHGIGWFEKQAALFGWLRSKRSVNWHGGGKMVSREEIFHELARTSIRYDAVEVLPHEPPIPTHYYSCETPPVTNGDTLRQLLDRFRPETTIDRDLIQAAIMSTFWGGPPGSRPAFVITATEGRGVGKTKLAEMIAHLALGMIDVSAGEDIAVLKQRFLSPEALTKRVALIDNVKSMRFSWAELESLITTPTISGKRLYVGEAARPNTLTWFVTLNGVNLATDMAQRSVIIKLVRGENRGTWYEDTIRFIDENRQALIGDIIGALRADPSPLHSYTRWAAWEKDILCRLPEPGEAQKVILERQGEADCEQDEAGIIEDFFADQLTQFGYDPETAQVRIPVATVCKWYCWATNEICKTASVTKRLKQMAEEGPLKRLSPDTSRHYGRCFIWTGVSADVLNEPISNDLQTKIDHYLREK